MVELPDKMNFRRGSLFFCNNEHVEDYTLFGTLADIKSYLLWKGVKTKTTAIKNCANDRRLRCKNSMLDPLLHGSAKLLFDIPCNLSASF